MFSSQISVRARLLGPARWEAAGPLSSPECFFMHVRGQGKLQLKEHRYRQEHGPLMFHYQQVRNRVGYHTSSHYHQLPRRYSKSTQPQRHVYSLGYCRPWTPPTGAGVSNRVTLGRSCRCLSLLCLERGSSRPDGLPIGELSEL